MDTAHDDTSGSAPASGRLAADRPRRRRPRRRWRRAGLQLLVGVLLLEGSLHLLRPQVDGLRVLLHLPDTREDYTGVSTREALLERTIIGHSPLSVHGGYVLNTRGFRTPEYEPAKPPGTRRLLLLGDSFTFGCSGLPRATFWPELLERGLEAGRPDPLEVVNLGITSVGPAFYLKVWELEGRQLGADLVVVAFFVGNDFYPQRHVLDGPSWVVRNSLSARLLRNLTRVARADVEGPHELTPITVEGERGGYEVEGWPEQWSRRKLGLSPAELDRIGSANAWIYDPAQVPYFERTFDKTFAILWELVDDVRATGAEALVMGIPDRVQVNPEERPAVVAGRGAREDEAAFDWEAPQRRLAAALAREGIPWLDLLPGFQRAAATGAQLYNEGDIHWSPAGSRLAAALLVDAVKGDPALWPEPGGG